MQGELNGQDSLGQSLPSAGQWLSNGLCNRQWRRGYCLTHGAATVDISLLNRNPVHFMELATATQLEQLREHRSRWQWRERHRHAV